MVAAGPPREHHASDPIKAGAHDDCQLRRLADSAHHQLQVRAAAAAHPVHQLLPGACLADNMIVIVHLQRVPQYKSLAFAC